MGAQSHPCPTQALGLWSQQKVPTPYQALPQDTCPQPCRERWDRHGLSQTVGYPALATQWEWGCLEGGGGHCKDCWPTPEGGSVPRPGTVLSARVQEPLNSEQVKAGRKKRQGELATGRQVTHPGISHAPREAWGETAHPPSLCSILLILKGPALTRDLSPISTIGPPGKWSPR